MKLSKKIFFSFMSMVLILIFATTSYSMFQDISLVKDGGTFYKDVPEAKSSLLGASNYFHIFANKADLRNHTNGNVATRELSGTANFGTQNIQSTEYNYAQQVKNINEASGIEGRTKMVFGKDVSVDVSDFEKPKVNGKRLDRVDGNAVFQDKFPNVYIDFDAEFQKLNKVSNTIINQEVDKTYSSKDFPDRNNRVIDISNFNQNNVYIKLTSDILQVDTPLTIAGLEKNSSNGQFKNVYIIVDTGTKSTYTSNSQIKFIYTDGSERGNKETIDFSDSTVLWTFEQSGSPFKGDIDLKSTWLGSILAPKAALNGEKNIDGNIIVDEFKGAGETHSWHWQQNKGGVILEKIEEGNKNNFLKGAVFSLYTATDDLVKEKLVTDDKGQIKVDNLPLGKYYFVETQAPAGYELSKEHHKFEIKAGETSQAAKVEVTNKKELGQVELQKTDIKDGKKLVGAEFSLFTEAGDLVKEKLVTDDKGQLKVDNLPVGKYYFVETKAPAGYELSKEHHKFEIKAGETSQAAKVEVTNKKELGQVELQKTDIKDGKKLVGAEFSLYTEAGDLVKEKLVTDDKGQLKVDNLPVGKYYFVETKAPAGYELSKEHHKFEIKAGETSQAAKVEVTNKKELGQVELQKTDIKDGKKLVGAEFSLFTEAGDLVKEKLVTNDKGQLKVDNLPVGKYYFVETQAPAGYELSKEHHEFEIKAGETSQATKVEVTNKKELGQVELQKIDIKSKEKLVGAEFSLFTEAGDLVKEKLVTNDKGQLKVDNLPVGKYYFVETKAPAGYELSKEHHKFEIKAGETSQVTHVEVTNEKEEKKLGSVELKKVDASNPNQILPGAEFSLYQSDGTLRQSGLVTNESGLLRVNSLEEGSYYFIETKAPEGYSKTSEKQAFEIKVDETTQVELVQVTNQKTDYKGSVVLVKTDQTNNQALSGAEFSLYKSTGDLVHANLITNETGQLKVENLAEGSYYFVETKAPVGYVLSAKQYAFEIKANETSEVAQVAVTNQKEEVKLGSVELQKFDAADKSKVLVGAEFALYQSDDEPIQTNLVTDESGLLRIDGLAEGSYYFVETKAPDGYKLSDKKHHFEIEADKINEVKQVEVTNEKEKIKLGSVELKKVDATNSNKVLQGAEFSLYQSDDTLLEEGLITNNLGILTKRDLVEGKYYFVETKAPDGYKLSDKKHHFEIESDKISEVKQVEVTNEKEEIKFGSVELKKVDASNSNKVLEGAEFSLYQSDGKLLEEGLTTNSLGILTKRDLVEGTYYFVETKAPKGYVLSQDKHAFTIKNGEKASVEKLTVTNKMKPTTPKEPDKPTGKNSGGTTTTKRMLPKTGEKISNMFVYGWMVLLTVSFMFLWKKKSSEELN